MQLSRVIVSGNWGRGRVRFNIEIKINKTGWTLVWPWGVQVIRINMDVMITHCPNVKLPVRVTICVYFYLPVHLFQYVSLPVFPPMSVSVCLYSSLPACQFGYIHMYLSFCLPMSLSVCLYICPSVCFIIRVSIFLSVCFFASIYQIAYLCH